MTLLKRDVKVDVPGGDWMGCYMAAPERRNGSALIVLQEIFGVNANIRSLVEGFAENGLLAIAPDLFWRQAPGVQLDAFSEADRDRATALMKGLDPNQAVDDAKPALNFARTQPHAAGPAFAVGYCLGGKIAFLLAARGGVDSAVSYYGVGIQGVLDEAPHIGGRVLLHIAQEDHLCPPEAQAQIAAAMSPLEECASILTYPSVGHAFARRGGVSFNQDAAERADKATAGFLKLGLGAAA